MLSNDPIGYAFHVRTGEDEPFFVLKDGLRFGMLGARLASLEEEVILSTGPVFIIIELLVVNFLLS